MFIQRLYLRHFRNYSEADVSFSQDVNLIRGSNAQGKTNLLEALYLLGTGRSFRTPHLKEMIQNDASFFFIEAEFLKDGIAQRIRLSFDGEIKKLDYNNTSYAHFSNLLGLLPIVLLAPEDVLLITGAPAERRRFLDIHLAQSDPLYVYHLTRYHKAVKHRNFLLRKKTTASIETWESLMVISAAYLRQKRQETVTTLIEGLKAGMLELSNQSDLLEIKYNSSYTENYLYHRAKELILGTTLIGPHRDDLEILINGQEARSFASQGQLRSAVAAMRLAQWHHLKDRHQAPPLFCIDDFGVHLDGARREALLEKIAGFGQVFLTSPAFFENPHHHVLDIEKGAVV
ncbi:MAG TPA: DNA replication and repair protein RecF [Rhabdochlamydiaceae bacterium]|nr:DNA replication and repair protein RecF [Rhabdochlamydiaceae bacterium]